MDLAKLREPFKENEIEWRVGRAGGGAKGLWARVLAYVTARAIMDRLDEACGPENWRLRYRPEAGVGLAPGYICTLGIRVNGEWVEKEDGAEQTDIESFKGALSGALKRAAVQWGVGRYLYNLEEGFAEIVDKGTRGAEYQAGAKDKSYAAFYWLPPKLPAWALPGKQDGPPKTSSAGTAPSVKTGKKASSASAAPAQAAPASAPELPPNEAMSQTNWEQDVPQDFPTSPKTPEPPKMPDGGRSREQLNRVLMNLYRPYLTKFPETQFVELLRQRYEVGETRLMTIEQIEDLVKWMELRIAEVQEPAKKAIPPKANAGKQLDPRLAVLKEVTELVKKAKWTDVQAKQYVKAAFKVASAKDLNVNQAKLMAGVLRSGVDWKSAMQEVSGG
jgi:hypothetical protein